MIASFSMYDRAETREVIDLFWQALRREFSAIGIDTPESLSQDADVFDVWTNPGLVLSHTCGMPFRKVLHGKVTLIGTPDFGVENCPPGHYRSAFVVRNDETRDDLADFAGARFAFNEEISQSGFAAPMCHAAAKGLSFENRVQSGGHVVSAEMVAKGEADIAALDAVTWRLIQKYDDFANDLRILEWTDPATPSLPLISAKGRDRAVMFSAVARAIESEREALMDAFGLQGLVYIPEADYLAIPNP